MGRNPSRDLVVAAQLTGIAAGFGQVKRCSRDQALAEIAGVLASARVPPGSERAIELLSTAAAGYIEPTGPGDAAWYPTASALLVAAGAGQHELRPSAMGVDTARAGSCGSRRQAIRSGWYGRTTDAATAIDRPR